jgi:hypothetical protein
VVLPLVGWVGSDTTLPDDELGASTGWVGAELETGADCAELTVEVLGADCVETGYVGADLWTGVAWWVGLRADVWSGRCRAGLAATRWITFRGACAVVATRYFPQLASRTCCALRLLETELEIAS